MRQDHLRRGEFGCKAALNFNAFIEAKFIGEKILPEATP